MAYRPILFIVVLGLILALLVPGVKPGLGEEDFIRYWSSTRLLVSGLNPYDTGAMRELQVDIRPELSSDQPVVEAWNPPWLMLILVPLSIISFDLAVRVWLFLNILLIGLSLLLSWKMISGEFEGKGLLIVFVAGFVFGETLLLIYLGQVSGLVLLGLILFTWWIRQGKEIPAGAALILTTTKPHVAYLALFLVLVWVVRARKWRVLAGLIGSGLISAMVVWLIYPGWITSYVETLTRLPYFTVYTSTLGSFLAPILGTELFRLSGLLLLPLVIPLMRLIETRSWLPAINLALLVSVPLSPYGFSFDQVVLLPAIVQILYWLLKNQLSPRVSWIVGLGLALAFILDIWLLSMDSLPYYWFVWTPILLLGVYTTGWVSRHKTYERLQPSL